MNFDRFDIAEAWFLALTHCHGGQFSKTYARLCQMQTWFKPAPTLCVESLSDNALVIYDNAVRKLLANEDF